MAYIKGEAATQGSLFPVTLDELIPDDHLVRVISAYVDQLPINTLGFSKAQTKATGRPPYDPRDMLKLYLYGYLYRIRSSRRLESESKRNVEVMWLLNRLTPDFKTIAEFRRLNRLAFIATCRSFVQFCRVAGLIAGELVAIDGSKFQAVASRKQHISTEGLARQAAAIETKIAHYLETLEQQDQAEEKTNINPKAVQAALDKLKQRQIKVTQQQAFLQENDLKQYVLTEPDARMMRHAHGKMVAYNVQTAVDSQHALIVHHEVTQDAIDNRQLKPMAIAVKEALTKENLKENIETNIETNHKTNLSVVADAGYSNGEQFQACEGEEITAYVPLNRAVNNKGKQPHFQKEAFNYCAKSDSWRCPNDCTLTYQRKDEESLIYAAKASDCQKCPIKANCTDAKRRYISRHVNEDAFQRMEERLKDHPEMMALRRKIVEHPFGNLKQWVMGNGRFLMRGLMGASTEMALCVLVYNLKRVMNILGVAGVIELMT